MGEGQKWLAHGQTDAIDPSGTSDLIVPFAGGFTFAARSQRVRLLELD
jgi:hypothetical protein